MAISYAGLRRTDERARKAAATRPLVRRLVWLGVAAAVVALVAVALRPQPIPVEIDEASRGRLQVTLDEQGETRVRDRFVVPAPVGSHVLRIELEPGDVVQAGRTPLATLSPQPPSLLDTRTREELAAQLRAAAAALAAARAQEREVQSALAQAERDLQRSRELYEGGAIPRRELETAELLVSSLRSRAIAAAAAIRAAEADRERVIARLAQPRPESPGPAIVVRAPVDGVVLRRLHESEAIVPQGEPLVEIGDLSKLEIVADYLSLEAQKIRPGQPALIDDGGSQPLRARVRLVEPSGFTKISALGVEEQRVNVILDLVDPREKWAHLGDRFRVDVSVIVWEADDVLTVPTSSLVRSGEGWSVFVVEDGRAWLRPVEIGQRNDQRAQVVSGLHEGQQVIVYPGDTVADGVTVDVSRP
jgi:HlyD family secretion protein